MRFDLHNHTYYSDGVLSISELAARAKNNKIDYFAITDHDSVMGLLNIPSELENKIIKGIELSTYHNESIHLIGLFKDNKISDGLIDFTYDFLKKRKDRTIKMVNNLHNFYNLNVDLAKLIENADIRSVTRGNMARMLYELNKDRTSEEIKFYLSKDSKAYIPTTKMSVEEGIDFLKANNCLVILAHPMLYKKENLVEIIDLPYDGIEAIYPNSKIEDYLYFKDICLKRKLFISAGSDCHGDNSHSDIGTVYLEGKEFEPLSKALRFNYGNK